MKKYSTNNFFLLLLFLLVTFSCNVHEQIRPENYNHELNNINETIIQEAKGWYDDRQKSRYEKNARKENNQKQVVWKKANVVRVDKKGQWVVVVPIFDLEQPTIQTQLVVSGNNKQTLKAMVLQKIFHSGKQSKEAQAGQTFNGNINLLDIDFNLIKENIFHNGKLTTSITHQATGSAPSRPNGRTGSDPDCGDDTTCLPQVIVFAERISDNGPAFWMVVPYSYYPDWNSSNIGSEHGSWNQEYGGWNVDVPSNGYAYTLDINQVIAPPDRPIVDINKYLSCFSNDVGSSYKVTVCVDQPVAGDRAKASFKDKAGHTFLVLEQTSGNGIIRRSIGFYPKEDVNPLNTTSTGIYNDDSNTTYDISLTINLDQASFGKLLNNLSTYPTSMYDLNTKNCTDLCIATMGAINIALPDTQGEWFNGGGSNPADLGEDLRSMSLKPGMSRNTEGGKSAANAGCDN